MRYFILALIALCLAVTPAEAAKKRRVARPHLEKHAHEVQATVKIPASAFVKRGKKAPKGAKMIVKAPKGVAAIPFEQIPMPPRTPKFEPPKPAAEPKVIEKAPPEVIVKTPETKDWRPKWLLWW